MNDSGQRILVLIPHPGDVGFALGPVISAFFEAAVRITGSSDSVHFCFSALPTGSCPHLPASFRNSIAFDVFSGDAPDTQRLADYVRSVGVTMLFALDMPVQAGCLGPLRRAGIQKIVAYWGAPMSSPNHGVRLLAKRFEVRLLRQSRPDLFVFESRAMRDLAVEGRGIPLAQTAVVPTGTDVNTFRPLPSLSRTVYERFGIPADRRIVVFMGHFHERKGVHVLLRAADEIVTTHDRCDIHFLFLGTLEHEVTQMSHHFGASVSRGYVTFAGYHSDIPALLAGCYIGCVPSSGWDSFPMSSLEMQACGLPMIVSSLQGVPETIEEGVTGLVFPSGDSSALAIALLRLGDNTAQRDAMSQRARERVVQNFASPHYVGRLERAIRVLVET